MTVRSLPVLLSDEVAADPHAFYAELRAASPAHYDDSVGGYLVSRYEDVARIYRDPTFTTRSYAWQLEPVHGRTLLQMDGREHSRRRAVASPHFRGKGLDRWLPVLASNAAMVIDQLVERNAHRLVDRLDQDEPIDLMTEFANYFPVYVIADMLGLDRGDHATFHRWYTTVVRVISNLGRDPELIEEGRRTRAEIREFFVPLFERRRREPGEDLISALATAEVDGFRMTAEEVCAYVSLLLVAGAETTDKTFGSLFANLLEEPERWERVRADRELLTMAVAETLRFSPPTQINTRETAEATTVGAVEIPRGATVLTLIGSANRDPNRFRDPDRFDLDREDLAPNTAFTGAADHLAFGAGRHFCLGAMLARGELHVGTEAFLRRYPGLRLAGPRPPDVGVKMRGPSSVPVRLRPAS
jgi:cytochrome P450